MRFFLTFVLNALVMLSVPACAAQPTLAPLPVIDTKLSNGLRVILVADHDAPVFGLNITYNVGSRNEKPGLTGFAHLFEHMMFEGSNNVGRNEHAFLITNNGGFDNASTTSDRTNYFETLPKNQLALALFLESDRMKSLAVNQISLDNQLSTVKEEKHWRIDNQPYGPAGIELQNLAYDNFAYKHYTGSTLDLDRAKLRDFLSFFHAYYAPNNAVLTLVGDFDPAAALEKIKKYFGSIPSHPVPSPPDLTEPPHLAERREIIEDPLARLPRLFVAYHIPPGNTPDHYALEVLGGILSEGDSSRLYQNFVKEKQLATDIEAGPDLRMGPGLFYVVATPRPGVPVAKLENALYAEIASAQENGVTQRELDKARRQNLMDQISQRETALELANSLGEDAVLFNDPSLINTAVDKFNAVTAEEVRKAAAKYLIPRERTVVIVLPKAAASPPTGARP